MITIQDVFLARRKARDLPESESYSALDYVEEGLHMIGGCSACQATLAAYNAYPDQSGFWRCEGCLSTGFESVEAFEWDRVELAAFGSEFSRRAHSD